MITMDTLRRFGANTQKGLDRCMKNEAFYLRLVNMALDDANFTRLADSVAAGDRKAAFEAAHALKGVLANLALTPLCEVASEITELLRADRDADYPALAEKLEERRRALLAEREA